MEFHKQNIDQTDDEPSVPEKIRQFVHKNMHGLMQIVIKEETQPGRFKQLNKIILQNKKGEFPDEELEDIAVGIMRVIVHRDQQREETDQPIKFQIQCELRTKQGDRKRPSMEYEYLEDGTFDDISGAYYGGNENPLAEVVATQNEFISRILYHLDEAHSAIRGIANNNNSALQPLMSALGWMGNFYAAGLQNQQAALALIYDIKKAESEEQHKTRRTEKWVDLLKKPLSAMGAQFMPWAMAKMSGKPTVTYEPEDDDEEEDTQHVSPDGTVTTPITVAEADLGLTDEQKENPVAAVAGAIGMMIEAPLMLEIVEMLTKKERKILREMMDAKTDAQCVAAYDKFSTMSPIKLVKINGMLNDDQREALDQLGQLVAAVKKQWDETDDE